MATLGPEEFKKATIGMANAITKSSQLRDFVFDLPFIKSSWGILYHAYKEEPEKEIVSQSR